MAAKTYTYSQWRFIFFVVRKLKMKTKKTKKTKSNEITKQHSTVVKFIMLHKVKPFNK